MSSPTTELYSALQILYTHFNNTLFNKELPDILFTNQRQSGMMGYFAPNRWTSIEGKNCHEIAINPSYVGRASLIALMQTLVHEMTHCWQQCYAKPSRSGYHNKEWASKMIAIGLMPSATGSPGGAIVGQRMADYPVPKGKFILSCTGLLKDNRFKLPWVDRFALTAGRPRDAEQLHMALDSAIENKVNDMLLEINAEDMREQLYTPLAISFGTNAFAAVAPYNKMKSKYSCHGCNLNVWGKSRLNLKCVDCNYILSED